MSLTSYQAAPPRVFRVLSMSICANRKSTGHEFHPFAFPLAMTSLMCARKNSSRHSQLVGSWICGALVSEKDGGWRAASVVCAAFPNGRGEFDILFRAGT